MNKNLMFIALAAIIALALVGSVVLRLLRPDAEATFINTVTTMLGILTSSLVMIFGLGTTNKKIEEVQRQTNGTLSRERDENKALRELLAANGINPEAPDTDAASGRHALVE